MSSCLQSITLDRDNLKRRPVSIWTGTGILWGTPPPEQEEVRRGGKWREVQSVALAQAAAGASIPWEDQTMPLTRPSCGHNHQLHATRPRTGSGRKRGEEGEHMDGGQSDPLPRYKQSHINTIY